MQFDTWRGLGLPEGVPPAAKVKARLLMPTKRLSIHKSSRSLRPRRRSISAYQDSAESSKFLDQSYKDVGAVMKSLGLAKKVGPLALERAALDGSPFCINHHV